MSVARRPHSNARPGHLYQRHTDMSAGRCRHPCTARHSAPARPASHGGHHDQQQHPPAGQPGDQGCGPHARAATRHTSFGHRQPGTRGEGIVELIAAVTRVQDDVADTIVPVRSGDHRRVPADRFAAIAAGASRSAGAVDQLGMTSARTGTTLRDTPTPAQHGECRCCRYPRGGAAHSASAESPEGGSIWGDRQVF